MSFIALHLNGFQLGDELSLVKGKTISSAKKKKWELKISIPLMKHFTFTVTMSVDETKMVV